MSRFTELKASGTDWTRFSNSPIKGSWRQACGGEPQAKASREIDMESTETTLPQVNRTKIDAGQEPIRELFELLARYIVTGAAAYYGVVTLGKIAIMVVPELSQHPKGFLLGLLISFVVLLGALNSGLNVGKGQRFRRTIAIYAYPIILAAGLWGGYKYSEFDLPRTDKGRRYEAALSACMEQPMCIRRMEEKAP